MANQSPLKDEDRANLIAYLDGELKGEAARDLEVRLNLDPAVRAEAETLRRTWELLDYLPRPEASTTFTSRTLDRVSAVRPVPVQVKGFARWRPWALGVGWAAALLLAGAAGFAGMSLRPRPDPAVPADPAELEQHLLRDLRVIEHKRLYEHVENIEFLRQLDAPDLFGDDG
jgi:anti-sigma factor RsiW